MVVCEVKPHKEDPNQTRITVAGSKMCYPGDEGTPTGSLNLVKLIINSVLLCRNARFVCFDKKNVPPNPYGEIQTALSILTPSASNLWENNTPYISSIF